MVRRTPAVGPAGVRGRELPLRASDVEAVRRFVHEREGQKQGGVYLLVGDEFAGGARVLDGVFAALQDEPTSRNLIRGSLKGGEFVADPMPDRRSLIDRGEDVAKLIQDLVLRFLIPAPAAGLIYALVESSAAALRVLQDESASWPATAADPVTPILASAAEHPLVLLVDGMQPTGADWFWQLLADVWAPDAATDLTVVFVVALDAPCEPPAAETGLPPACRAATRLHHTRPRLAEWHCLAPITRDDVAAWLSPATDSVVDELWTASGESPQLVEATWSEWKHASAVEIGDEGVIRFAPDADVRASDLRTMAIKRIRALVPATEDTPFDALLALEVGALQGEIFNADAVAMVLGVANPETVVGFLDERLSPNAGPLAVIEEAGYDTVVTSEAKTRTLRRYRFTSTTLWLGLRTRGLEPPRRRQYAHELAVALESLFASKPGAAAASLAVLLGLSDDRATAARWEAISEKSADPEVIRWRAHLVLGADAKAWTPAQKANGVEILSDAYGTLVWRLPLDESRQYVLVAEQLAEGAESSVADATALGLKSSACARDKDYETAIASGGDAFEAWKTVPDRRNAAVAAFQLASVISAAVEDGRILSRPPEWFELLEFARTEGDGKTAGMAMLELATVETSGMRQLIEEALLVLPSDRDGLLGRAKAWHLRAAIEIPAGDLEAARRWLIDSDRAVRFADLTELLPPVLHLRGALEMGAAEFEAAITYFAECRHVASQTGVWRGSPLFFLGICFAEQFLGRREKALAALQEATKIAVRAGQGQVIQAWEVALDKVVEAHASGAYGAAYATNPASLQRQLAAELMSRPAEPTGR